MWTVAYEHWEAQVWEPLVYSKWLQCVNGWGKQVQIKAPPVRQTACGKSNSLTCTCKVQFQAPRKNGRLKMWNNQQVRLPLCTQLFSAFLVPCPLAPRGCISEEPWWIWPKIPPVQHPCLTHWQPASVRWCTCVWRILISHVHWWNQI